MTTIKISAALLDRDIFSSLIDHFGKRRKTEQLSAVSIMKWTAMLILSQSKQFWSNTFEQFIEDVKDLTDINVKCKVLFQDSTGEETTKVIQQLSYRWIMRQYNLTVIFLIHFIVSRLKGSPTYSEFRVWMAEWWLSTINRRTTNRPREPHIIWQRLLPLPTVFPSFHARFTIARPPAPCPNQKKRLRERE